MHDDLGEMLKRMGESLGSQRCPSCGLQGTRRSCPKCGRAACDKCIAVDNSDCLFCGNFGHIAEECWERVRKKRD